MRRDVFQAIADPNRRSIINLLAHERLTHSGAADHFDISRPTISKHIKILTEGGLIIIKHEGRERYCAANLQALSEVHNWIEQYSLFWNRKLHALGDFPATEKNRIIVLLKTNENEHSTNSG